MSILSSRFSWVLLGLLVIVSTAMVVAVGMVGYDVVTSPSAENQNTTAAISPPVDIVVPDGWESVTMMYEINPVEGGGPLRVVFLSPRGSDPYSGPSVDIASYAYNPQASLDDLMEVYEKNFFPQSEQPTREQVLLANGIALRIVLGNQETSGSQPYRTEQYLARLLDKNILEIRITYPTEVLWRQYSGTVDAMLKTITIPQ